MSLWLDSLNWQSFIEIGKMAVVRGLGALVDTLLNHSLQEKIREVELKLLPWTVTNHLQYEAFNPQVL